MRTNTTNLKHFRQFGLAYSDRIGHEPRDESNTNLRQMLLSVNYYDREKRSEGNNPTVGLVLCTEKNRSMGKYRLDDKNRQIFASKYQLYLLTEKELKEMVQDEVREFKTQFAQQKKNTVKQKSR